MRGIGIALFLSLALAAPANEVPAPPTPRALGSWAVQTSGVATALNGIAFFSPTEGFAVGASNKIQRTLDGGTSAWTTQTSDAASTTTFNAVALDGPDAGLAVGNGGIILRTTNGSTGSPSTWKTVSTGDLAAVAATDTTHAWTGSLTGKLRSTTDGGTTWPMGDPGVAGVAIRGMSFLPGTTEGYWVGDGGTAMRKDNGVATWTATGPTGGGTLNSISIAPGGMPGMATGWIAGAGGVLRVTTNSGTTWADAMPGTPEDLNGVFAMASNYAWAVGANSTIRALTVAGGATWNAQTIPDTMKVLNAVSFTGTAPNFKGVAVGDGGAVYYTGNSGVLWQRGTSGVGVALRGVAMLTPSTAVAVGDNGTLLKSTNSGNAWNIINTGLTTENIRAVTFVSATNGWAVGSSGTILTTTNGGSNWTIQAGESSRNLAGVKFGAPGVALAVGPAATILRTTTGGDQWIPLPDPGVQWAGQDATSVAFGAATRAVVVGSTGGIMATTDTGTNWTFVTTVGVPLTSVVAVTPTFFVAVGAAAASTAVGINYDSTGNTWSATVVTTPPAFPVKAVAFAPYSRQGYAVGDSAQIQATKDGGSTWAQEAAPAPIGTANINAVACPHFSLAFAVTSGGDILVRRSPAPPLLSFPPHVGTPYDWQPPKIDGFVNPELSELRRPDTGWNQALQVTYGDGTSQPPVVFQGLRHSSGTYLYLSFEVRADTSFDADDTVIVLFRGDQTAGDHTANDRRIIIHPLTSAGSPNGTIIADGYLAPPPPSTPYLNHENGDPSSLDSYKWDTTMSKWVGIPASTEIVCKVRSWNPDTGQTSKSWSVELQVPLDKTTYTDWIKIQNDFLFSFYLLRVQTGGVVESSWPRDLALVTGTQDIIDAPMSALDWGTAKLGTSNDGAGVRIKVPSYQNIWTTTPLTMAGTREDSIHGTLENTFHVIVQNDDQANDATKVQTTFRVANWGVQSGDPTSGAWRLVPANQSTTNPPPTATVPKRVGSVPGEHEFTIKWLITDPVLQAEYAATDHQCMLVTLDSVDDVLFSERSSWTNMGYVPASRFDRKAHVSSVGYGLEGSRKGQQRFYILTHSERFDYEPGKTPLDTIPKPDVKRDGQAERKDHPYYSGENLQRERLLQIFPTLKTEKSHVSHYVWSIHANKETSQTVTIHGHTYPILEQANGFGYIARHEGGVQEWTSDLSGAIVKKLNQNEYEVTVPANGSATMDSGLVADEGGGTGLLWLILLILFFLALIFWFVKKKP